MKISQTAKEYDEEGKRFHLTLLLYNSVFCIKFLSIIRLVLDRKRVVKQ